MSSFFGLGGKKDKGPSPSPTPPAEEKPKEKKTVAAAAATSDKPARNVSAKAAASPAPSTSSSVSSAASDARMELEVVSTPEAHLVYTNFVYLNPDIYAKFAGGEKNAYVTVAKVDENDKPTKAYFIIKPHKDIDEGFIALSSLQRDSCKLSLNGKVQVAAFAPPTDVSFRIVSVKLEAALLPKRKTTVKEAELSKALLNQFNGHIFCKNQKFCLDFEGAGIKVEVRSMEAVVDEKEEGKTSDDSTLTRVVKVGQLLSTSMLSLEVEETKYFKVEKDQSKARSRLFANNFQFSDFNIGGLDKEFNQIFRRAFASRLFPAEVIEQLGIKHVRGMLLWGPPGTGKTLIARQIGKMLNTREPKVVNGPEILNKFVGASEENIRKLFADAEADYAVNKENSDLHLIIFDEIDAICKARGSDRSGTGVHDTVVNQLLSKLDGVNSLNNILVIGMTNRKDLIDPALLRPGRLEVHIEISLPTEDGRVDIFKIHTKNMQENGKLGRDVDIRKLAQLTKNFSGAEIEGLVKSASSFALYGSVDVTKDGVGIKESTAHNVVVGMDHFLAALEEVQPAFGVAEEDLKSLIRRPPIDFGIEFANVLKTVRTLMRQLQNGDRDVLSVLLEGSPGCGKSLVAAQLALDSGFPFIKLISPDDFVGMSDASKANEINRVFEDAYKSTVSLVVVDGIERLLEYVPIGPRFSNTVLQTLMVLFGRSPPKEKHKIFVIATTNNSQILQDMQMLSVFSVIQNVPQISKPSQVKTVFEALETKVAEGELDTIAGECVLPISMGNLLLVIDMAKQDSDSITADKFKECLIAAGLTGSVKY